MRLDIPPPHHEPTRNEHDFDSAVFVSNQASAPASLTMSVCLVIDMHGHLIFEPG